ncbi:MAG: hypothetical protein LCH73_04490 [Proteobacteria bacterium]|nr:hypothetical protein [Pseudomonadota bacterium]
MAEARVRLQSAHWLGKTSAAVLLGPVIALGLSGLFAWLGPGGMPGGDGKLQFTMWLVAPIWVAVLCAVHLFRSGWRAWLGLGLMAAAAMGALALTRVALGAP